jgi:PAS domain S-box-containing protein
MSPCYGEYRKGQITAATPREAGLQFAQQNDAWLPSFGELALLAPIGIFCADAAGEYVFVNEKWRRTTGLSQAQAAGSGWLASIHAEDRERVTEEWRTAAAAGTEFRAEYRLHRMQAKETWVCSTAAVYRTPSGEVKGFLGILEAASRTAGSEPLLVRTIREDGTRTPVLTGFAALEPDSREMACFAVDMSGPQRAETALRPSEECFRRLAGSNTIGIVTADRERILDANDAYLQIVGYTREELRAGKIRWRDMTPAPHMQASEKCLEQMLATGMCPAFEKEHRHKDGHYVPILIGAALLERDPLEWVCFILDLTERKNMEERLREAQKFESIGMLAAGVAHDFNNLMSVVLGWTSFARDALARDGLMRGGEIDRALEFVSDAADRAANLTRQLLAYAGKGSVLVESLDFSAAVRQAVAQMRGFLCPDVELRMQLPDELPRMQADPTDVRLLVTNLLMNAIEAIGEGSGTIWIEAGVRSPAGDGGTPNGHGPIHGSRWIGLTVRDTGCGMDPAIQTRIFDPFFTTKFMGRGLGLAAVHGIVRSMQGFIRIDSAPGRGSTFEIYLPLP